MNRLKIVTLFLGLGCSAWGQVLEGVSAVATRTVTVAPTQTLIAISVSPGSDKTFDDVMARVKDLGLGLENLGTITTIPGYPSPAPGVPGIAGRTAYSFTLTVPLAQTAATLQKVKQSGTADYPTEGQVAGVRSTVAAAQEAYRNAYPELYREAKARAEEMARGAGLSPGRVLAVGDTFQLTGFSPYTSNFQLPVSVGVRIAIE